MGADRMTDRRPERAAALLLLTAHADTLSPRAGQFCGQIAVSGNPLTEKQGAWMAAMLERAGLPPLANGGDA